MKWLVSLWVLLMGADFLTTLYALQHGHVEGNPLMAALFAYNGLPALGAKLAAIGIIFWIAYSLKHWRPLRFWFVGANVVMSAVVMNNLWRIAS